MDIGNVTITKIHVFFKDFIKQEIQPKKGSNCLNHENRRKKKRMGKILVSIWFRVWELKMSF